MGMAAAFKARRVLQNAQRVVAAEFLCGAQGLDFLLPLEAGRGVAELHRRIRQGTTPVARLTVDRPPAPDLAQLATMVAGAVLDPRTDAGG